jgi:hypothetical protein
MLTMATVTGNIGCWTTWTSGSYEVLSVIGARGMGEVGLFDIGREHDTEYLVLELNASSPGGIWRD